MSSNTRKIGYYSIELEENDNRTFDSDLFKKILMYINQMPGKERIIVDNKAFKAVDVELIKIYKKSNIEFARIIFKSCKFNHSPKYMSSVDGTERDTDKKLYEGEKELCHMLVKIDDNEAFVIFEERRSGVSIKKVVNFLNTVFIDYKLNNELEEKRKFIYGYVLSDNYDDLIKNSERVISAELFTERKLLGSEYLNISEVDDSIREDVVLSVKSKQRGSITKKLAKNIFNSIAASGSIVKRVRLYTKDSDNLNVIIDSGVKKKNGEISVELNNDGTVNTHSIFLKMEEMMEEISE